MDTTRHTLLEKIKKEQKPDDWDTFDRLYRSMIVQRAMARGFQAADADDIAQDVFVKLRTSIYTFDPEKIKVPFRPWLFKVVSSVGEDFRTRRKTRQLPGADGLSGVEDSPITAPEDDEYNRLLIKGALDLIRGMMKEKTVTIFIKVKLEGKSVEEVAAKMGVTPAVVHSAVHRVMTKLKQILSVFMDI